MPGRTPFLIPIIAFVLVFIAAIWMLSGSDSSRLSDVHEETLSALVGGSFELIDHHGQTINDEDLRGFYLLIYFGFTHCPDVCPTALQEITDALGLLGGKASQVQPLFITVDPDRDTPSVLADYVSHFHPRMLGLTGSSSQIRAVAGNYKVYFANSKVADGGYMMDHTSIIYLMDREGRYITHFGHGLRPQAMADRILLKINES